MENLYIAVKPSMFSGSFKNALHLINLMHYFNSMFQKKTKYNF